MPPRLWKASLQQPPSGKPVQRLLTVLEWVGTGLTAISVNNGINVISGITVISGIAVISGITVIFGIPPVLGIL